MPSFHWRADRSQRCGGRLPDDEAVRHVPDAGGDRHPERAPPRPGARHAHRRVDRQGPVVHLGEVAAQVAGEVVERAAWRA